ncbi:14710_t:CDS:2, partial [Acaulospora colombiana]
MSSSTTRYNPPIPLKPTPIQRNGVVKIRDLQPWIRGFDLTCIILQRVSQRTLKTMTEVELHSFLVADETAVCTLVIWENGQFFKSGDVVQINQGETRIHEETFELTVNSNFGKIRVVDWDVLPYVESESPNLSKYLWVQNDNKFTPMTKDRIPVDPVSFEQLDPQLYTPAQEASQLTASLEIKQEENVKIKQEDEEMGNTTFTEVKQEQSRIQPWKSQIQQIQQQLPPSSQPGDRRLSKRKASYLKWENRDRDQQDRGDRSRNQDRRGGRQQSRNRGGGRDWLDR